MHTVSAQSSPHLIHIRLNPNEPFPPDQRSGLELSGCRSTMRMPKAVRRIITASAFSCLVFPAFNNLLKGVILESTPQNNKAEK
jgi:hypothetical protein